MPEQWAKVIWADECSVRQRSPGGAEWGFRGTLEPSTKCQGTRFLASRLAQAEFGSEPIIIQSNLVRSERFVSESLRIRNSVADPLKLRW
jgi:hypothetical protein